MLIGHGNIEKYTNICHKSIILMSTTSVSGISKQVSFYHSNTMLLLVSQSWNSDSMNFVVSRSFIIWWFHG